MNVHMLLLNCNTLHKYRALHSIEKLFIMSNNNNKCYYTISYIHFSQNKMQSQKEFSFKINKNLTKFFSSTESANCINALCIHNMLRKFNRIKTLWIAMIIIVFFFYFSLYMVHNSLQFFALFFVWFASFVDLS